MSIDIQNLHVSYRAQSREILSGLTAQFSRQEITVLTGPSGCGKSTLLYFLAGLYPKYTGVQLQGNILVEGQQPSTLISKERCRLVGMMFQNPDLQFTMDTVWQELVFCLENLCVPPEQIVSKANHALAFCQLEPLRDRKLQTLSGGQKQQVMLACQIALEPQWLLLDEPFANLDDHSARLLAVKLLQLHRETGVGILAVDHRLDHWMDVADTIRVMDRGQLSEETFTTHSMDPERLTALGIYCPGVRYCQSMPPAIPGPEILTLHRVSVSLSGKPILSNLSATFHQGRSYAIVGASGCGKSTLFGALSGLYPYTGQITLDGRTLRKQKPGTLGFVTQSPQDQFLAHTVLGELLATPHSAAEAQSLLTSMGLWPYRDVSPYLLSQGQQRRLGVTALMAYPCRVLICDEPTYAQDRRHTIALMEQLLTLVRTRSVTLIFSTHDRQAALDYADEILELKGGCLYAVH